MRTHTYGTNYYCRHVCYNIWEFYCQEMFLPKISFTIFRSQGDFLLRFFFPRSFVLSLFLFYLFVLFLTIRLVADRSQVAIGIYPRGCVEKLLKFSLVVLSTKKYGFGIFLIVEVTVPFLCFSDSWRWEKQSPLCTRCPLSSGCACPITTIVLVESSDRPVAVHSPYT